MNNASKGNSFFSAMSSTLTYTGFATSSMEDELSKLYGHQLPTPMTFPFYHRPTVSLLPFLSDKYLSLLAPFCIYWVASLWYCFLDMLQLPFFEKYRLHEPQEISKRNRVTAKRVVLMVLLQQFIQTILGLLMLDGDEVSEMQVFQDHKGNVASIGVKVAKVVFSVAGVSTGSRILHMLGPNFANWIYWWGIPTLQFAWAFFVMDAWEYMLHRAFHESRFLYKHFHSHHHRLYVPYSFGALYNHPLEGLLLDSAGAVLSHACALMTMRQGILLFTFSTYKTVADHSGYAFPIWLDPLHLLFPNNAEYHDVHHQMQGLRYNYSQPFFIHFDVLFGTRMSAEKFAKMRAVNQRFKAEGLEKDAKLSTAVSKDPQHRGAAATAIAADDDKKSIILRNMSQRGGDQNPEDIALQQGPNSDLLVTNSAESYRAKAGIAV